ncbi:MAG TPA: hypothetical protein VNH11_11085 [Pirellulales bacterium]|nr:hypothetical protein [Pirellulales bacterium]
MPKSAVFCGLCKFAKTVRPAEHETPPVVYDIAKSAAFFPLAQICAMASATDRTSDQLHLL